MLLVLALLTAAGPADAELFPLYPSIRNNVAFWEDVYSRYTTTQGILHDQDNLQIVYGVVDLMNCQLLFDGRLRLALLLVRDLAAGASGFGVSQGRHIQVVPFCKLRFLPQMELGEP